MKITWQVCILGELGIIFNRRFSVYILWEFSIRSKISQNAASYVFLVQHGLV